MTYDTLIMKYSLKSLFLRWTKQNSWMEAETEVLLKQLMVSVVNMAKHGICDDFLPRTHHRNNKTWLYKGRVCPRGYDIQEQRPKFQNKTSHCFHQNWKTTIMKQQLEWKQRQQASQKQSMVSMTNMAKYGICDDFHPTNTPKMIIERARLWHSWVAASISQQNYSVFPPEFREMIMKQQLIHASHFYLLDFRATYWVTTCSCLRHELFLSSLARKK